MKKRNVTITLEEETARWARVEAARRDVSVSRLVNEMLREEMLRENSYGDAMSKYLDRGAAELKRESGYPARDKIHRRAR